jgi:hypothetical protein
MNKQKSQDGEALITIANLLVQESTVIKGSFKINETITNFDPLFDILQEMKKIVIVLERLVDKLKKK